LVDVQTIGVLVTAASVSVAAIYYIMTLRTQQANMKTTLETRQAQLLMQIYNRVSNRDFARDWAEINYFWKWNDNKEYWKKYGTNLRNTPSSRTSQAPTRASASY
jgi:hypothetical protein